MITIPTITQIAAQIIADIETKIGQTVPTLPKAFYRVLAYAQAGVIVLQYRFAAWIYLQIFAQTADEEALVRIGEQYGIFRAPAVAAVLTVTATGANDTVIPAGTLWTSNGTVYQQGAAVAIAGGTASVQVTCLTTGDIGNLANGTTISLATPIAGVIRDGTVAATVTTGEDVESLESYRSQVTQRQSNRPQGGAAPDYVAWALEVPGIVKAFAYNTAPCEVTVYPLQSLTTDRIPNATKLDEVEAYLSDTVRRPLCATVIADYMTERTLTPTVTSISPDSVAIRQAVEDAWSAYLLRAFPKQYADEINPTNVVTLAAMYAEAFAAGATSIILTMAVSGTPGSVNSYDLGENQIIKLGTTVWPV